MRGTGNRNKGEKSEKEGVASALLGRCVALAANDVGRASVKDGGVRFRGTGPLSRGSQESEGKQ